jgi:hypothetical protein
MIIGHAIAFCAAVAVEFPLGTVSNLLLEKRKTAWFNSHE